MSANRWGADKPLTSKQLHALNADNQRAAVLTEHVKRGGNFDIDTLARSYALPRERVAAIVERHGGQRA